VLGGGREAPDGRLRSTAMLRWRTAGTTTVLRWWTGKVAVAAHGRRQCLDGDEAAGRTGQSRPRRGDEAAAAGRRRRGVDEHGEDGGHEALLAHGRRWEGWSVVAAHSSGMPARRTKNWVVRLRAEECVIKETVAGV
jgi:hypothetical protein